MANLTLYAKDPFCGPSANTYMFCEVYQTKSACESASNSTTYTDSMCNNLYMPGCFWEPNPVN